MLVGKYLHLDPCLCWTQRPNPLPDLGIKSTIIRLKVDSGIGLPMINVLESTLASEVIVNYGIGSHTPCFSLDSASGLKRGKSR